MAQENTTTLDAVQALIARNHDLSIALLQRLHVPDSVIVAGANRLNPHWLNWPGMHPDHIVLIDGQNERLQGVQRHLPHARNWRMRETVLDTRDGAAPFHTLSHANESGLLSGDELKSLWPNIRTAHTLERSTQTLDNLLATDPALADLNDTDAGWLIIDSLPAARILNGAMERIRHCTVVGARVVLDDARAPAGTHVNEVRSLLEPLGFRHVFSLEETHPAIVMALFTRSNTQTSMASSESEAATAELNAALESAQAATLNAQAERDAETQARIEAESRCQAAETALEQTKARCHATENALAQETARCEALETELALASNRIETMQTALAHAEAGREAAEANQARVPALEARVAALTEELGDLTHAWEADVQAKTNALAARDAEARATTEALKARDMALAQLQQKEAQLATLTREKAEFDTLLAKETKALQDKIGQHEATLKSRDAIIVKLTNERDQALKQHANQTERMQQLESENAQAHHRHQVMQDELAKAEVQIELIKDLLLREQGL